MWQCYVSVVACFTNDRVHNTKIEKCESNKTRWFSEILCSPYHIIPIHRTCRNRLPVYWCWRAPKCDIRMIINSHVTRPECMMFISKQSSAITTKYTHIMRSILCTRCCPQTPQTDKRSSASVLRVWLIGGQSYTSKSPALYRNSIVSRVPARVVVNSTLRDHTMANTLGPITFRVDYEE